MKILFYIFCLFVSFFSYKRFKDVFHPVFITSVIWFAIVGSYNFLIRKTKIWIELSDLCYLYLIVYILIFSFSSFSVSINKFRTKKVTIKIGTKFNMILLVSFFVFLYSNLTLYKMVRSVGMIKIRDELDEMPFLLKIASYIQPLILVALCYGFDLKKNRCQKIFYSLCFAMVLLNIFFMASKGGYFQIIICLFFMLHEQGKLKPKIIIPIATLFIALILGLQFVRSGSNSKSDDFLLSFFYIYFLSPVPAFDILINHGIDLTSSAFGGQTLIFFYRFLSKIGLSQMPYTISGASGWLSVPYMTNVYTLLGSFYIDFNFLGIVLAGSLYGGIFGFLYSKFKLTNSVYCKIFYSLWLYVLFFQFFGVWFFSFFSYTLQTLIWCFFLTNRFKTYALKFRGRNYD